MLFQWYRQTPNMLDIGLAPVIGATVMTRKAWNAVSDADRPKLRATLCICESDTAGSAVYPFPRKRQRLHPA